MSIKTKDDNKKEIIIAIPLTKGTEKTRIKKRRILNEYGFPVATRTDAFCQQCYVEWQIGYDVVVYEPDKLSKTTLKNQRFIGANGKEKTLYELSEYIYYFYKWNVVSNKELTGIQNFLGNIDLDLLLDVNKNYMIERGHPIPKKLFNIDFEYTQVKYPLLIHKFDPFEIITEIKITEKQYAVGLQPMLYFCFPVTELKTAVPLVGRVAEKKENADFVINPTNIQVFLEGLKIFGILSENHRKDIISIIDVILK